MCVWVLHVQYGPCVGPPAEPAEVPGSMVPPGEGLVGMFGAELSPAVHGYACLMLWWLCILCLAVMGVCVWGRVMV